MDQEAIAKPKYAINTHVKHLETGVEYVLHLTPDNFLRLENSNEPAYAYAIAGIEVHDENPIWLRSQKEIEDETKYELIGVEGIDLPTGGRPKQTDEQIAAEKAFHAQMYNHFQPLVTETVGKVEEGYDEDALRIKLTQVVAENATKHFSELFEINIGEVWIVQHAGKGGLPLWIADHAKGIQVEISTLFDVPITIDPNKPSMVEVDEVTAHHVEGSKGNLVVKVMRATDAPHGEERFDFYDVHGMVTEGLGGRGARQGTALVFQTGKLEEVGPTGLTEEALLAIVKHRLKATDVDGKNLTAVDAIGVALSALKAR